MKKISIVIMVLILHFQLSILHSQTPQAIKYQAVARDASGKIIASKSVSFKVSILKGSESGTVAYSEIQNATTNTLGLVNLNIGTGTKLGNDFSSIEWGNDIYFLKLEIDLFDGAGYTILGISQMLSVPYALYAENANVPGVAGPTGATGDKGDKGDTGAKGVTGAQGITGVTGQKGDKGEQGVTGIQGITGPIAGTNKQVIFNDNNNSGGATNFVFDKTAGNAGIGTDSPVSSAMFDVTSTTKGLLPPRMTDQQRNAIVSPVDGLEIFNTTTGCLNFYKNISWFEVCGTNTMAVPVAGSNTPVCSSDILKLTAKTISGATYSWTGPNNFTSSIQNPQITNVTVAAKGDYTVKASNGNNSNTSVTTVVVNPLIPVSLSIKAYETTICAGEAALFTATATNGGTAPKFQWKKNAIDITGATSTTYVSTEIVNNDKITCVLTSNITPCPTNNPATSNEISMTINPLQAVSIIINTANITICAGETALFTATATNGGTTPKFQWKKNAIDIVGATNSSYSASDLANNDKITCLLTSNISPCPTNNPATSNEIKMTVNPLLPVSVSIATTNTSICVGTNATFTATATNGGTAPAFQWKKNNSVISGATLSSYSTTTLADKDSIICVLTSSEKCTLGNPATSNKIKMTILSLPTTAAAGSDQIDITGTSTTLAANTPIYGTGLWTIQSGTGGKITTPNSPTSTFTGSAGNAYVLRWTISNTCGGSYSDVNINFKAGSIPTLGLIAYYPFNGNANDESGNNHNGNAINGALLTTDRSGNENKSYSFDGNNDYVIANIGVLTKIAVSLWYNSEYPVQSYPQLIYLGLSSNYNEFSLLSQGGNVPAWIKSHEIGYIGSYPDPITTLLFTPSLNQWHHVVVIHDHSQSKHALYIDGNLIKETSTSKYLSSFDGNIYIGNTSTGKVSDGGAGFKGKIDDIRIYNRVLNQDEINSLYYEGSTPCPGNTIVEYGNQNYHTVQIGTQCWMKENMNIGTMINGSINQTNNSMIEKYCYNDTVNNCYTYGGLYQWDEMMQYVTTEKAKGICPIGWHIPSDAEWYTLENYVDPTINDPNATGYRGTDGGDKLKEVGTAHWSSPNTGSNSSGFIALPGGIRDYNGSFSAIGARGFFWTSSPYDSSNSWSRHLGNNYSGSNRDYDSTRGFSLRCMKD